MQYIYQPSEAQFVQGSQRFSPAQEIKYTFLTDAQAQGIDPINGSAFSAGQESAVREMFNVIEGLTSLKFTYVPHSGITPGVQRIRFYNGGSVSGNATDFIDLDGQTSCVDVLVSPMAAGVDKQTVPLGEFHYWLLMHEIGHALGLKHPYK